jgi:hypothetical protein
MHFSEKISAHDFTATVVGAHSQYLKIDVPSKPLPKGANFKSHFKVSSISFRQ